MDVDAPARDVCGCGTRAESLASSHRGTLPVQVEITREVALALRARAFRHATMARAPARFRVAAASANRAREASVWTLRMVVRAALVACVAGILPSLVRAAVACALGAAAFLAVFLAGGVAIASFEWRELGHAAPATRFEPKTRCSDETKPGEKTSRAPGRESNPVRSVCVIGGGAAGIVTARHMRARGFDVTLFERSNDVGGLWRYGSETCKVFANVTQNLTKNHNRFAGLKPPNSWPNYLGHEHTVLYLSAYVDAFALRPCIKLNHEVRSVVRRDDGTFEVVVEDLSKRVSKREDAKKSRVQTNAGKKKPEEKNLHTKRFDAVAVCAGQLSVPNVPDDTAIPGLSGFTGEITHTSLYRTNEPFRGKRVLVVGVGAASGSDVAQDLCGVAAKTTLAARSHRWLIRRGLTGGRRSFLTRITDWLPCSFGLLAHLYFESVPTLRKLARTKGATDGGDLLAAAALGRVTIKPALVSVSGDEVTFQDGSFDRFDVVIFATGFRRDLPFDLSLSLKEESFESESSCDERRESFLTQSARDDDFSYSFGSSSDGKTSSDERSTEKLPTLYRGVLCADAPRVAFVLYVLPFGSHFQVAELQSLWASRVWRGELGTPSVEDMRRLGEQIAKLATHESSGEYYRAAYARLLAPSLFGTESFVVTFAKLLFHESGGKYVEPVLEWLPDKRVNEPETKCSLEDAGADAVFKREAWSGWSVA